MNISVLGQVIAALTLLLQLLAAGSASAHLPEYFGRFYVLEGQKAPDEPEPCAGDRDALRAEITRRHQELSERSTQGGPYSVALADATGELGKLYSLLCNHPAALGEYRRSVHLLRISDGLLTRAQLPYLRAEAESYREIGDFESAQKTWRYVFRIHGLGRGALDKAAFDDSLSYFARARSYFIDPRSSGDKTLFYQAYRDNKEMLEAQRERGELGFDRFSELALSHLANLYLVLGTDLSLSQLNEAGSGSSSLLYRLQEVGFSQGLRLLEELSGAAQGQPKEVRAAIELRLGNWSQWNVRELRACEHFVRAWELAGEGSPLRARLAQPAELPEDAALWSSLQSASIPVRGRVRASFAVSRRGDVSRVSGDAQGGTSSALAGRVVRWLRDSHARPAVIDGECVGGELRERYFRILR